MAPVVYFMVVFSIVVHGLSIPALNVFYHWRGVPPLDGAEKSFDDISLKEAYFSGGSRRNRFSRVEPPGGGMPNGVFADPFSQRLSQDFSSAKGGSRFSGDLSSAGKSGLASPPPAAYRPSRPDGMMTSGSEPAQPQRGITFAPHVKFPSANPQGTSTGNNGGSGYESGEDGKPTRKNGLSFISSGGGSLSRRASSCSMGSLSRNSAYRRMPHDDGDTSKMV